MASSNSTAPSGNELSDELHTLELRAADTVGALMEFWGFKRPMGRLWTLLFLSPEPMPAAELGEKLSMSAGAVSMALAELQKWGAVRRTWRPGERRDFFEAETSVWKLATRVFRERELTLVREAAETFGHAAEAYTRAARSATREQQRRIQFARDRLQKLRSLARLGETLLGSLVSGARIDTKALRDFEQEEDTEP